MGMSCPRYICPLLSGSVLSKVGLSLTKWACPKLVCPVQEVYVLVKVGLSCPKWVCAVQGGSVLS